MTSKHVNSSATHVVICQVHSYLYLLCVYNAGYIYLHHGRVLMTYSIPLKNNFCGKVDNMSFYTSPRMKIMESLKFFQCGKKVLCP